MVNAPDPVYAFAEYAQQRLGVPWPTSKELAALRRKVSEAFARYPQADWYTMCRLVGWCRSKRRRYRYTYMVVEAMKDAVAEGALPELDGRVADERLEQGIADALAVETDPTWRARLLGAAGPTAKAALLADWHAIRGS